MKSCINLSTLLVLLTAVSGCSKFKELTRRDYAMIRDPFAAKKGDVESEPPVDATRSTSGFVRIDDTESRAADPVKADYSAVAQNQPASPTADAGFQGIRVRGMGDAISTQIGAAGQTSQMAADSIAGTTEQMQKAADKTLTAFNESVKTQTAAINVSQSKPLADSGFSEWASSEVERWKSHSTAAPETATPLLKQIQQVSKTVEHAADIENETASAFSVENTEAARPLISPDTQTPVNVKRELLKLKPGPAAKVVQPPSVGDSNPFANLEAQPVPVKPTAIATQSTAPDFDDFTMDASPAQKKPAAPASANSNPFAAFDDAPQTTTAEKSVKGTALDSGFNFDTGWRPSDAVSP